MRPINKDILKLAIPSILANITVPLVCMVDIAVAGHLSTEAAPLIGGIALGSMLYDLLYWNFGFLRVGTGGLTAQACGREDRRECTRILVRALGISWACALVLIAVQWVFIKAAFLVVDCTPDVHDLASRYFFIRICKIFFNSSCCILEELSHNCQVHNHICLFRSQILHRWWGGKVI